MKEEGKDQAKEPLVKTLLGTAKGLVNALRVGLDGADAGIGRGSAKSGPA